MNLIILFLMLFLFIVIKSQKLLKIESVSNTTAVLTCDNCSFQKDRVYQLKISKQNNSQTHTSDYEMSGNITMVQIKELEPAQLYQAKLIDLSPDGKFIMDILKFTTKPSPPSDLKFIDMSETEISLMWTTPHTTPHTTHNTNLISISNDSQSVLDYWQIQNDQLSISKNISNLISGKAYILVIINTITIENDTEVVSEPLVSKFRIRPHPPTDLIVDEQTLSSHSLDIHWEPPQRPTEFDGYYISYISNGKPFIKFVDIERERSLFINESIYPGKTYKIKLNSVSFDDDKNQSSVSVPIYCNITTRPLPVFNLRAKTVTKRKTKTKRTKSISKTKTNTEVIVEWSLDSRSTQDSYIVSYWELNSDQDHFNLTFMTRMTYLYLEDLFPGHTYSISVVALSNNIQSNATYIRYEFEQPKSSKLIPAIIALIILSVVCLIVTGLFIFYCKQKDKYLKSHEEQIRNLIPIDTIPPTTSNDYTVILPFPQIDENIRIEREDLELKKEIGKGQFGTVYSGLILMEKAQLKRKVPVAIKTSTQEHDMTSFLKEAFIMNNFDHKNVLSLIGVSLESNGRPLVVLPLMENGDLLKYIRSEQNEPTVKQLINFAIDVANGMEYLSKQHFVHRDLAARNCMLSEELIVKIADFGLSRHLKSNNIYISDNTKQLLPIRWMSIESIEKSIYDTKTDVWSYGVLVWEILTRGVNPYSDLENREVLNHLKAGNRLPQPLYCPKEIYETLEKCWDINSNQRPTFVSLSELFQEVINSSERNIQQKRVHINEANIYYNIWDQGQMITNDHLI